MDEWNDETTPELERDLKALFTPDVPAVDARERAFLKSARWRVSARRSRPWRWLAAAAGIVVLCGLGWQAFRGGLLGGSQTDGRHAFSPHDIDRDGRVDVRDAYLLAREVARGLEPTDAARGAHDVNGDGVLNREDVDLVLARVVSLTGGEAR